MNSHKHEYTELITACSGFSAPPAPKNANGAPPNAPNIMADVVKFVAAVRFFPNDEYHASVSATSTMPSHGTLLKMNAIESAIKPTTAPKGGNTAPSTAPHIAAITGNAKYGTLNAYGMFIVARYSKNALPHALTTRAAHDTTRGETSLFIALSLSRHKEKENSPCGERPAPPALPAPPAPREPRAAAPAPRAPRPDCGNSSCKRSSFSACCRSSSKVSFASTRAAARSRISQPADFTPCATPYARECGASCWCVPFLEPRPPKSDQIGL